MTTEMQKKVSEDLEEFRKETVENMFQDSKSYKISFKKKENN